MQSTSLALNPGLKFGSSLSEALVRLSFCGLAYLPHPWFSASL